MPIRIILNFVKGMSQDFTHFQCPVCGRSVGAKGYDPEGRPLDVLGKSFRGLGRGRGFEVSDEESILHTNPDDPVLLKIKDRVADVYDMFFEDDEDEFEELVDRINEALGTSYDTLMAASEDAISRLEDLLEETRDEDDPVVRDEEDYEYEDDKKGVELDEEVEPRDDASSREPMSELDYEILRGELEEES